MIGVTKRLRVSAVALVLTALLTSCALFTAQRADNPHASEQAYGSFDQAAQSAADSMQPGALFVMQTVTNDVQVGVIYQDHGAAASDGSNSRVYSGFAVYRDSDDPEAYGWQRSSDVGLSSAGSSAMVEVVDPLDQTLVYLVSFGDEQSELGKEPIGVHVTAGDEGVFYDEKFQPTADGLHYRIVFPEDSYIELQRLRGEATPDN